MTTGAAGRAVEVKIPLDRDQGESPRFSNSPLGRAYPVECEGSSHPVEFEGSSYPVEFEGSSYPVECEGSSYPVEFEGSSYPVEFEGSSYPVECEGNSYPMEFEGSSYPVEFEGSSYPVNLKAVAIQWIVKAVAIQWSLKVVAIQWSLKVVAIQWLWWISSFVRMAGATKISPREPFNSHKPINKHGPQATVTTDSVTVSFPLPITGRWNERGRGEKACIRNVAGLKGLATAVFIGSSGLYCKNFFDTYSLLTGSCFLALEPLCVEKSPEVSPDFHQTARAPHHTSYDTAVVQLARPNR
ncbi:hypothetical protein J6590_058780 [Homalodisca vitripennis]|nr:hypothetical protein J6590_058780 [Homalodisca vitripennis]